MWGWRRAHKHKAEIYGNKNSLVKLCGRLAEKSGEKKARRVQQRCPVYCLHHGLLRTVLQNRKSDKKSALASVSRVGTALFIHDTSERIKNLKHRFYSANFGSKRLTKLQISRHKTRIKRQTSPLPFPFFIHILDYF